jgi:ATP-dependent RNA helicase RhlE
VLILTPTRELAAQVHQHFVDLAAFTPLKGAAVFGGVGMEPQARALRSGVDVVVATPGRLLDHLQNGQARLDQVEFLVLDEADRMLDMGFLPDVRRILARLPKQRQTMFFSATLPPEVTRLAREMLVDPVALNVERKAAPATGVSQRAYPVPGPLKSELLLELLRRNEVGSVLVFTRTKHRTNRLSEFLDKRGVPNARMHGNRSQAQRTEALAAFKAGTVRVLCATDIVARGIDVEALQRVINFDVPHLPEDYIHRVGRTARADQVGEAWTFVSREEESDFAAIERAIGRRIDRVQLEGFDTRQPAEPLEIPLGERLARMRAQGAGSSRPKRGSWQPAPAPGLPRERFGPRDPEAREVVPGVWRRGR